MSKNLWITKVADRVENFARRKGKQTISCASGISPSGVIHLGNLREIFSVHLIVQELKERNWDVVHLHFWDDYDRFRKIPADVSQSFEEYIGKPLSEVPDPYSQEQSYADHFKKKFEGELATLGIFPKLVSQSQVYKEGTYNDEIKNAFAQRLEIFDVLASYINPDHRDEFIKGRSDYYPFKVYCTNCGKDDTKIQSYDLATSSIQYTCSACANEESYSLDDKVSGKLVWKVDWPMRWHFYDVDYEPGGVDHSTPGSSFTVGKQIISDLRKGMPPQYVGYAFVGLTGGDSKISSSAGSVATPGNALKVLEPALLRWLYVRTDMRKSFNIAFDKQIFKLYDEWDNLAKQVSEGKASEMQSTILQKCLNSGDQDVAFSDERVPFRMLCSAIELTQNNQEEVARIISEQTGGQYTASDLTGKLQLRYECARNWVEHFQPEEEKIKISESFNQNYYDQLDGQLQDALKMLIEELDDNWSIESLSTLIYRVPKQLIGHPLDEKPTDELKVLQRSFFVVIYQLIVGDDTGPRIPTLFTSLGKERIKRLLGE